MASILKRQKLSEEQYKDRISNLPNSLIAQILSRLPTKYAVSTSVLSTRWKQLWTSITSFDIDDNLLLCPQNKSTDPSLQRSFTSFVQGVLLRHVSCVQRFRLKCSQSYDASLVNGWIADTLLRNIQELDLDLSFWMRHSTVLPQDLFTCRTLVVLKLNNYGDMNTVPTSVFLPSLRILHLDCIGFVDDDSINRFLFGCPVLEELSMSGCVGGNVSVINIVAPMLTSLFMHDCLSGERKIVLDTPALLYLTIMDSAEDGCYLVENLCHLIRADIFFYAAGSSANFKALTDLLKGMSNVQFLQLGFSTEWEFLLELLENSPHLETLVFKEGLGNFGVFTQLLWNPAPNVPSCLLFHLKVIGISDFRGEKEEWRMVDYLLQKAKVLEKVNIDYCDGGSKWTIHASRT
ncbi:hypothetical protein RHGRI_000622 [Rhododendron griersonianum]|uniref:F-box domain-containing protein n=1 Tax=Rhododendron griersonianum TaxID=479676 RepID=A0AAV6LHR3_9ERIC|nr:hypothetical protein RHGRI_000622 [Rhododendron griersonianum]